MAYKKICVPLEFQSEDRVLDSSNFLHWFNRIIPERQSEITSLVRYTPKYGDWVPDYSENSLSNLSDWFPSHVHIRERSAVESALILQRSNLPSNVQLSTWILDEMTESICVDIGIYVGEMLKYKNPELNWIVVDYDKKKWNKSHSGFPVLSNNKITMDSVSVVESVAQLIAGGVHHQSLKRYIEVWEKKLNK